MNSLLFGPTAPTPNGRVRPKSKVPLRAQGGWQVHSEVRAKVDRERMGKGCNQACLGLSPQLPPEKL